jgi:hypothetical protein
MESKKRLFHTSSKENSLNNHGFDWYGSATWHSVIRYVDSLLSVQKHNENEYKIVTNKMVGENVKRLQI